jgi:hypothetical protein
MAAFLEHEFRVDMKKTTPDELIAAINALNDSYTTYTINLLFTDEQSCLGVLNKDGTKFFTKRQIFEYFESIQSILPPA